jgi:hypothetical protein
MHTPSDPRPRFAPDDPLPPYTFVPGRTPHPVSDPAGHSFGAKPERPAAPDPARWRECRAYLRGLDLFNHGYYWEAHEAWEGLWHACGRTGPTADFLKGLIQLAVAGVKVREGRPAGVAGHAARAVELFHAAADRLGGADARFLGLRLGDLLDYSRAGSSVAVAGDDGDGVRIVFDFVLLPRNV